MSAGILLTCGIFDKETDWVDLIMTGSALERCSEAFARSATSLILLEKDRDREDYRDRESNL